MELIRARTKRRRQRNGKRWFWIGILRVAEEEGDKDQKYMEESIE